MLPTYKHIRPRIHTHAHTEFFYYTDLQNSPSRFFALHPLPVPASHVHPLFCCRSPPFLLLKQFPISMYILIHLPSKLFIYFRFALIYTPFNLSLLFSVLFYISLFWSFPRSLLPPNYGFYLFLPSHTLIGFLSPSRTFYHCRFTCSHVCSTLLYPSHSTRFPSRHLAYPPLY